MGNKVNSVNPHLPTDLTSAIINGDSCDKGGTVKVLLVEDNYYTRDIVIRRLKRQGHQVVTSVDGLRCLELAHAEQPDVILLDMRLPVISGVEIAKQLKADPDLGRIPIIAMTAYGLEESRDAFMEVGCEEFESKPLDFGRLLEKMHALVEHHT